MTGKIKVEHTLIALAESVCRWSVMLLDKAPLTEEQREDIVAIRTASEEFVEYASEQISLFSDEIDKETKKEIRHQLRNYLNVIVGFSRMMVKELPDNLLMDMVTVRKIHDIGEMLMVQVDAIQ